MEFKREGKAGGDITSMLACAPPVRGTRSLECGKRSNNTVERTAVGCRSNSSTQATANAAPSQKHRRQNSSDTVSTHSNKEAATAQRRAQQRWQQRFQHSSDASTLASTAAMRAH
eukprot:366576-Chlamydomonas_euryale.AAC.4